MGKRRQELDHKTREQMEQESDEEEDTSEENYERVTNWMENFVPIFNIETIYFSNKGTSPPRSIN